MAEHSEVKSDNARNVILSYGDGVYFVSGVNVQVTEGSEKLRATFHARRSQSNEVEDLNIDITKPVYDVLVEYAKMDKLDMILVLQILGDDAKWCLMSENWLANHVAKASTKTGYIV
jgi:hypothetical protein